MLNMLSSLRNFGTSESMDCSNLFWKNIFLFIYLLHLRATQCHCEWEFNVFQLLDKEIISKSVYLYLKKKNYWIKKIQLLFSLSFKTLDLDIAYVRLSFIALHGYPINYLWSTNWFKIKLKRHEPMVTWWGKNNS